MGFSQDDIEPNVPGTRLDPVETLALVRDTDQPWLAPARLSMSKSERAIVEAAPHAETIPPSIEPDQRQNHEIEMGRLEQMATTPDRLRDPEAIGSQPIARTIAREPEEATPMASRQRTEDRQVEALAARRREPHQRTRIDLAISGPVERDTPSVLEDDQTR